MKSTNKNSERRKARFIICLFLILLALLVAILTLLFARVYPILYKAPKAVFTYSPLTPQIFETVTFDACASYDPDGIIVNYTWNFGDSAIITTPDPIVNHTYSAFGNYFVMLTVTDNDGLTDSARKTLVVVKHPIARFTYSPLYPVAGEIVTFDASESTPNGGWIVLYEWDFGDTYKFRTAQSITTHAYTKAGTYEVVLSVTDSDDLQGITSKPVNVTRGAMIDLYTQHPDPYGGRGLNRPSDAFAPHEEVVLKANVTFKAKPIADTLVLFKILDPTGNLIICETATTVENGIATVRFRIPWQFHEVKAEMFGTWFASASTEVIGEKVNDTLTFEVGWIVELVKLETYDYEGNPKTDFTHNETVYFKVHMKNIAMVEKNASITVSILDELNLPIGLATSPLFVVPARSSTILFLGLKIPIWASVGWATAYANAFTDLPSEGGLPYCPQISTSFFITPEPVNGSTPPISGLVDIVELDTYDYEGNPKTSFSKGEDVYIKLCIQNNDSLARDVAIIITLFDESQVPIGQIVSPRSMVPSSSSLVLFLDLKIPIWASVGHATAYANAYTALPTEGGAPYCPQVYTTFSITY